MGIDLKRRYCFAFLPTVVGGRLVWWVGYHKIYSLKEIDVIQCDTTDPRERCTTTIGYKKWVLIDKKIISVKK